MKSGHPDLEIYGSPPMSRGPAGRSGVPHVVEGLRARSTITIMRADEY
jgi:hypothetical protein